MIIVIDMQNAVYRSLWSTPTTRTPDGFDITGLYSTIGMVLRLLAIFSNVNEVVACCDPVVSRETNWRYTLFPQYKADRVGHKKQNARAEAVARSVRENMPYVRAFFGLINCTWLEDPCEEADDLIAYAAGHWPATPKLIVSRDWDMFQLVQQPLVELAYPEDGEYAVINAANFQATVGRMVKKHKGAHSEDKASELLQMDAPLPLDLWLPFRALVGDRSDCIPGLRGVKAARGYDIVTIGGARTPSRRTFDIFMAWWNFTNRHGDAMATPRGIMLKNPDAEETLDRNDRLMRLDPQRPAAFRSSFRGQWNPTAMEQWFRQLNFRSMLPGGHRHDALVSRLGGLRVTA